MNKGDAVIFSNIDSVHGVKMLTSGERYSLAMWLKDDI
jgi:predicted 2-oxoglutarate/Fe(II)-dependent dioxygenase YbiX